MSGQGDTPDAKQHNLALVNDHSSKQITECDGDLSKVLASVAAWLTADDEGTSRRGIECLDACCLLIVA